MGVFSALFEPRAASESTLAKPSAWLLDFFGGGKSASGISVNEESMTALDTVWACVRAIAEDIAKLPIRVIRDSAGGNFEVLRDHPVSRLLNYKPNSDPSTAISMREALFWNAILWGNGFAEIERDGAGRPLALWWMDPKRVKLRRVADGTIVYDYTGENGSTVTLEQADVFHVRGPSRDGIVGLSVIAKARESVGLALAAQRFAAQFWSKGGQPQGVLSHPAKLGEPAKKNIRESWRQLYGGENAGSVAILDEGIKYDQITMPLEDAQFLETRQFSVPEICRWFRISPHKVQDHSRSTFNNIEHLSQSYIDESLTAWITRFEQEAVTKLLMPSETNVRFKHVTAALIRGDMKSRYEAYAISRQNGWRSANEVRRLEDEETIGPEGDTYMVPVNMQRADKLGEVHANEPKSDPSPDDPPADQQRSKALRAIGMAQLPVIEDALDRVLRIEADKASRAQKRGELATWSKEFYASHVDHVRGAIFPAIEAAGSAAGAVSTITPDGKWLPAFVLRCATIHVNMSRSQASSENPDFADWLGPRAERDAKEFAKDLADELVRVFGGGES